MSNYKENKSRIILGISLLILIPVFTTFIWYKFRDPGQSELEKKLDDKTIQSEITKKLAAALNSDSSTTAAKSNISQAQAKNKAVNSTSSDQQADASSDVAGDEEKKSDENDSKDKESGDDNNYKNEELGISFDYSKDYKIIADSNLITVSKEDVSWKMRIYEDKKKNDIEAWFKGYFNAKDDPNCLFSDPEIKVGSYDGKLVKPDTSDAKCDDEGSYAISRDKSKKVRVYVGNETKDNINKALESFKFLNDQE